MISSKMIMLLFSGAFRFTVEKVGRGWFFKFFGFFLMFFNFGALGIFGGLLGFG